MHFLSDAFVAVALVVAEAPYYIITNLGLNLD